MGCWNGSCAMTGLPVFIGNPVRVFLLVERDFPDNHCYTDAYWAPMHYHFKGQYNDYGSVEECSGEMIPVLLDIVRNHLFEMDQGENECHDIPVKADKLDLDLLFEADHETRLKLKPLYAALDVKDSYRVSHIIIHEYVFQQMLERYTIDSYRSGKVLYADIVKQGMQFIEDQKELIGYVDEEKVAKYMQDGTRTREQAIELVNVLGEMKAQTSIRKTYNLLYMIDSLPQYGSYTDPLYDLTQAVAAGNYEAAAILVEQIAAAIIMYAYMTEARRMWTPMSGAGSQNESTSAHVLMADLTKEMAVNISKRWDEDEE